VPDALATTHAPATTRRSTVQAGRFLVELIERPGADRSPSQDSSLVVPRPDGGLRAVALDGVTPMEPERRVIGLDEATYAAGLTRTALLSERPATDALRAANNALHRAAIHPSRLQRQTCATVADIAPDGRVRIVQAGDCVAFARTGERIELLVPDDAVDRGMLDAVRALRARRPSFADVDQRQRYIREEAELLEGRSRWRSTAVGRFADPILIEAEVEPGWDELVLASDGAALTVDRVRDLDAWAERLATEGADDDLTLIRIRPTTS
jgi:hypothetical protein